MCTHTHTHTVHTCTHIRVGGNGTFTHCTFLLFSKVRLHFLSQLHFFMALLKSVTKSLITQLLFHKEGICAKMFEKVQISKTHFLHYKKSNHTFSECAKVQHWNTHTLALTRTHLHTLAKRALTYSLGWIDFWPFFEFWFLTCGGNCA